MRFRVHACTSCVSENKTSPGVPYLHEKGHDTFVKYFEGREKSSVETVGDLVTRIDTANVNVTLQYFTWERGAQGDRCNGPLSPDPPREVSRGMGTGKSQTKRKRRQARSK